MVLPEYPYMDHSSIRVDPALLDRLAGRFLDQGGSRSDISTFLFYYIPVWALDAIGKGGGSNLEELEGLLYLSGFFGGVWLKGVLHPEEPFSGAPSLSSFKEDTENNIFSFLASFTELLNDLARSGKPHALTQFAGDSLNPLLFLYGYNLGYLQGILDNPPAGAVAPEGYLTCDHLLDCRTPLRGISLLEELLPLLRSLRDPPDSRWSRIARQVRKTVPSAMETGARIWSNHLSVEDMRPESYHVLLDLSAGFLLYSQVLVLSAMDAWGNGNPEMGRSTVGLNAGMAAWAGGYGIGLVSRYPGDHLPRLE